MKILYPNPTPLLPGEIHTLATASPVITHLILACVAEAPNHSEAGDVRHLLCVDADPFIRAFRSVIQRHSCPPDRIFLLRIELNPSSQAETPQPLAGAATEDEL